MLKRMVMFSLSLCFGFGVMAAYAADDFAGEWTIRQEFGGQERVSTLTIGEAGGTWATQRGTSELTNFKNEDGQLSFTRHLNFDGREFSIDCEFRLVDGMLVGTMTTPRGERDITATRVVPAPTFVGEWDIEMDFGGRTVNAKLNIKEKNETLSGLWSSQRGENELDNVVIKGDTLSFDRTMERQGQEFSIAYSAKIVDGMLDGTMSTRRGDLSFKGTAVAPVKVEGGQAAILVKQLDQDGDGLVSEEEAPERLKQFFGSIDANGDGNIDVSEMKMIVNFGRQQSQ